MEAKLAMMWKKEKEGIRCNLCGRKCFILPGKRGFCMVRENRNNKLYTLNYGRIVGLNFDPIEKKPLFHFFPGSSALSYACRGCNWRCSFCLSDSTIVITDKGILSLKEIFEKSEFTKSFLNGYVGFPSGLSIVTHEGNFHGISKVFKHEYIGEMIVIKPYYLPPLECTPSHEIFVFSNGKIVKKRAGDVSQKDLLVIPKNFKNIDSPKELDLKHILSRFNSKFKTSRSKVSEDTLKSIVKMKEEGLHSRQIGEKLKLNPNYVRRLLSQVKKIGIHSLISKDNDIVEKNDRIRFKTEKKPLIPRFIKVNEQLAELLGLYCAEGHVSKCKKRPSSFHLVFSFGKKEKKLIEKTSKFLKEIFEIEPKIVKRKTTTTVEVRKTSVALFFKMLCGDSCKNKEVPPFIFSSSKSIARAFIKGFLEGDGWVGKDAIDLCTTSKKLAFGIYFLLLTLGILPAFYEIKPKNEKGKIEGREVNLSTSYRVKIVARMFRDRLLRKKSYISKRSISPMKVKESDSYFLVKIREIQKKFFEGDVYNLEVDGNPHSYLANFVSVGNCCNWLISHDGLPEIFGDKYEPEEIVEMAEERNCKIISHTYTEPTVYFEFAYEVAKLAHKKGMLNTFVTNGYMSLQALRKISRFLDAATVDFKASNEPSFLLKYSSVPSNEPVFEFLKGLKKYGIHTEITNLIIPKIGDNLEQFRKVVKWIVENLGQDVPFHVLRFHPDYMLTDIPTTPIETLENFIEEAKKLGLKYVYIGNVPGHRYENTYCPNCNELLIERTGFWVEKVNLEKDKCKKCGEKIKIVV